MGEIAEANSDTTPIDTAGEAPAADASGDTDAVSGDPCDAGGE
jgi:hypothetical protein